jgi:hypothetical protein
MEGGYIPLSDNLDDLFRGIQSLQPILHELVSVDAAGNSARVHILVLPV